MKSFGAIVPNQWLGLGLVLAVTSSHVHAQQPLARENASHQAAITFNDIDGAEHSLPCKSAMRGLVLVFINTECPIANSYHPVLRRLRDEFSDQRFDFAMVHANADLKPDVARKHQQEYEITWPIVLDPGNRIARRVSAKVTPEAVVVDAQGKTLYRGRIDDRHQDYGRKRPEPTTQDLHRALTAILQNAPLATRETKAIGCIIRYAD